MLSFVKVIKEFLMKYVFQIVIVFFLNLCYVATTILWPKLSGNFIDNILSSQDKFQVVYTTAISMFCVAVVEIGVGFLMNYRMTKVITQISFDLNYKVIDHVKRLPMIYFKQMDTVYLNKRINADANTVTQFVLENYSNIIINFILFFSVWIYTFSINARITGYISLLLPIYVVVYFIYKKPLYRWNYKRVESQNSFFSKLNEQMHSIKKTKINYWYENLGSELKNSFFHVFAVVMKYTKLSFLFSSSSLCINRFASVMIAFLAGIEFIHGRMTVGNYIMINTFFMMMLNGLSYFLNLGKGFQEAKVAHARIMDILDREKEFSGEKTIHTIDTIQLQDVSFSFDDRQTVIENFNYTFKKGNLYAICGKNGTGKTTMMDLLVGLYDYTGTITYNGMDLRDLDMHHLRKKLIGVVEQEPQLLNGTVFSNLTYGVSEVDPASVENWCKKVNLQSFIDGLPNQMDTSIGTYLSSNVSGGEKQKIALVRALVKNAQLIILDEPTSALDRKSIEALKETLEEIKKDKIVIMITHDDQLVHLADDILVLGKDRKIA